MTRSLIISGTVVLLFILQSLPAYRLNDMNIPLSMIRLQADIACIFCVYLGVREKYLVRGALLAFVVGYFANTFAPTSMRVYSFLAPACFIITYFANVAFYFKRLESMVALVFFISVAYDYAFFYLMSVASKWHGDMLTLLVPTLLQALVNALFSAVIFTFFDWILEDHEQVHSKRFRY